ncbi:hypothetical protein FA13DRAFT_1713112 [Coprinellus micaceus]|uniref:Uncharacterized protein n=1 Tax=Coprinellus micaceus TaxID=71717 RepID=A0A4Y7SY48_COPMI|nr:hypothetical protein FA13DRAFT_1713112 [Coprinellus micaceus]
MWGLGHLKGRQKLEKDVMTRVYRELLRARTGITEPGRSKTQHTLVIQKKRAQPNSDRLLKSDFQRKLDVSLKLKLQRTLHFDESGPNGGAEVRQMAFTTVSSGSGIGGDFRHSRSCLSGSYGFHAEILDVARLMGEVDVGNEKFGSVLSESESKYETTHSFSASCAMASSVNLVDKAVLPAGDHIATDPPQWRKSPRRRESVRKLQLPLKDGTFYLPGEVRPPSVPYSPQSNLLTRETVRNAFKCPILSSVVRAAQYYVYKATLNYLSHKENLPDHIIDNRTFVASRRLTPNTIRDGGKTCRDSFTWMGL